MGDEGRGRLARLVAGHFLAVVTEWASVVAVLVYAFDQSGTAATGLASLALLAPQIVGAPAVAVLTGTIPPARLRLVGLGVQATGFAVAGAVAAVEGPVVLVVLATVIALGALSTLRPTGAVLLPSLVRSTVDLARANLRIAHAEAVSAFAGPLVAAGLLAVGGPDVALLGCALLIAAALLLSLGTRSAGPSGPSDEGAWRPGSVLAGAVGTLRARPWTVGVLAVVTARSAVIGALDVVLVVLAFDELGLAEGGSGLLGALVGAGALASSVVTTWAVRRNRLAPLLAIGLGLAAVGCLVVAVVTETAVVVVVLPVLGLCVALLYGLGTILLQRSGDPRVLGSLFALIELTGGVGLLVGSLLAQVLIGVADVRAALVGLAVLLAVVLVLSGRGVWHADADADVPVVEMSVLQALPMFAALPPLELEAVARSAHHVEVPAGEVVIRQGDPGETFYAVASGAFDIVRDGGHVRRAERGSCFGEVALLADVDRTATVTAAQAGELLAVDRGPFLVAVTGRATSLAAAWGYVQAMPVAEVLPTQPVLRPVEADDEP